MSERGPHPFPPVVRWAVFPAIAALAGVAGGVLASLLHDSSRIDDEACAIAAALAAGSAFAAALSVRPWIALLAGHALGILILCGGLAAFDVMSGRSRSAPGRTLLELLRDPRLFLFLGGLLWLQAAAHVLELRPGRSVSALRRCLTYLAAAALALPLAFPLAARPGPNLPLLLAFAFLVTILQSAPLLASLALARRLQK